jgi:hypothetical protein
MFDSAPFFWRQLHFDRWITAQNEKSLNAKVEALFFPHQKGLLAIRLNARAVFCARDDFTVLDIDDES